MDPTPKTPGIIASALAHAAIRLGNRRAALQVLCVMAPYMDDTGSCQIRQRAIANRLGISLQAANKQFRFLEAAGLLSSTGIKIGLAKSYRLLLPCVDQQPAEVAAYGDA